MNFDMTKEAELDRQLLKELLFEVEIEGQKYPVGQPSSGRYRGEDYGWDPAFFIHSLVAVGEGETAVRMMDGNAAKIKLAGYLPLVTRWDPKQHDLLWRLRTKGDPRFSVLTQQPLTAQTALMLLRSYPEGRIERAQLLTWAEAAQTHIDWLVANRRLNGRHLFSIIDPIESGEDTLPAWNEIAEEQGWALLPRIARIFFLPLTTSFSYILRGWNLKKIYSSRQSVVIEPVSMNVLALRELLALEVLWRLLGRKGQAAQDRLLANQLDQAIQEQLWNEELGAYFPQARFRDGWRQMPTYSVESLYPLLLPDHPIDRIAKLVDLIEQRFIPGAKYMLPVAPIDPQHPQKVLGRVPIWWPEQVWASTNWFFRDGLAYQARRLSESRRGFSAQESEKLSSRIDKDWQELKEKAGYSEFYYQAGTGGAEKRFFWSCLRRAKFLIEIK